MLTEVCFGNFYTRELMMFYALVTLGDTERQQVSHMVGNSKKTLLATLVQLNSYIGLPHISNAISVIKDSKFN